MSDAHKRNLAVPFFTQRDNSYVWQQKYKKDKIDEITGNKIEEKRYPHLVPDTQWPGEPAT